MTTRTASELCSDLETLHKKSAKLARRLSASLAIRTIWPDAFSGGQSCKLCAQETIRTMEQARKDAKRGGYPELKECYLLRDDGERFEIAAEQFWQLKEMPK